MQRFNGPRGFSGWVSGVSNKNFGQSFNAYRGPAATTQTVVVPSSRPLIVPRSGVIVAGFAPPPATPAPAAQTWFPRVWVRKGRETVERWQAEGIPPAVVRQVRFTSRQFVKVHQLDRSMADDIASEFWIKIWRAIESYDEARSAVTTFTRSVLDMEYRAKKRRLLTDRRRGRVPFQLSHDHEHEERPGDVYGLERAEWLGEFEARLESLPDDLRDLVDMLRTRSPAQIAEDLGVHRGTVYRRIERMREYFEDLI